MKSFNEWRKLRENDGRIEPAPTTPQNRERYYQRASSERIGIVFNTTRELINYVSNSEPLSLNGCRVEGELLNQISKKGNKMNYVDPNMVDGRYGISFDLEINDNGTIIGSDVRIH